MTTNTKPEYIQLEPGEDVASLRDRLSFIRGKRVLLIWPEEGTALTRKLDLVLVGREARRRVIQLALVTHDDQVIRNARELGISTFETIRESERGRWKRGRTRVFIQRYHKPEDEPDPEDLMPVASRVLNPVKRLSQAAQLSIRVSVLGAILGLIIGGVVIFLPSADIYMLMQEEQVNVEVNITADPNALDVDIDNAIVPATELRAPVRTVQQIQTSGIQQVEAARAIGFVSFTNNSSETVTIPAGTIVSTGGSEAVRFETTVNAEVSASGRVDEVSIRATLNSAGAVGNVAAGTIDTVEGELSDQLETRNPQPTTGGSSQSYHFVTQQDKDRLMRNVRGQLQSLAFTAMESEITESQIIVIETLTIPDDGVRSDWITFSHDVGDRSDILSLDMRVVVEALAIDDRFARQVVLGKLSATKSPQLALQPDSFLYSRGPYQQSLENGQITFTAFGDSLASAQVNENSLRQAVRGMTIPEARDYIQNNVLIAAGSEPQIVVQPEWFGRLPLLPARIHIETGNTG